MLPRIFHYQSLLLLTVLLGLAALNASGEDVRRPAVTELLLRPEVVVHQAKVTLRDVIELPPKSLDQSLLSLDLHEFDGQSSVEQISSQFIRLRVALARKLTDVKIGGVESVTIKFEPSVELTDDTIEQQAAESLAIRVRKDSSDVQVHLLLPVMSLWRAPDTPRDYFRFDFLWPDQLTWGRQVMLLRVFDGELLLFTRQIQVETARKCDVIQLLRDAPRGMTISEDMITMKSVFSAEVDPELSVEDALDRSLVRPLSRGSRLSPSDLKTQSPMALTPVIQALSAVRVVARKNGLQIVIPRAQALQAGAEGQLIRVKNLQSNRIITGRVVNASEVAVDLQ